MKIEVDFVESVVYVHSDQKRESSYVGVLYIHACIYVKKFSAAYKTDFLLQRRHGGVIYL